MTVVPGAPATDDVLVLAVAAGWDAVVVFGLAPSSPFLAIVYCGVVDERIGVNWTVIGGLSAGELVNFVAAVISAAGDTVAVAPVTSGDVTRSDVDDRVDCAGGRSNIVPRRAVDSGSASGSLFGLLMRLCRSS